MACTTLEDVLVNHEAVIFRRGRIYPESFVPGSYHARQFARASRYTRFLVKNYWLRRGRVEVPAGLWAIDNYLPSYHHWLVDALPRLLRAEEDCPGAGVLLLPRYFNAAPYIPFTLRAFPRIERIGWIGARAKVRVGELDFVPRQTGLRLMAQLREVADRISELAGEPGSAARVYFTREDARWRKARNEADVVRELRSHDFEIVTVDATKPWEQVRIARGARLMAGVHGAALTNLIFMQPGSQLLEFRHGHDEIFFDAYRPLAVGLGIEYRRQTCRLADAGEAIVERRGGAAMSQPERRAVNNFDLVVDIDALRASLRDAG